MWEEESECERSMSNVLNSCQTEGSFKISSIGIIWEPVKNAEAKTSTQTYWIKVWILTKSPETCLHINVWELFEFKFLEYINCGSEI